jgi:hypothetical protein
MEIRLILRLWMPHTQLFCIPDNHLILTESFPSQLHVKSVEDFAHLSCFDSNHQNKQSTKASTQLHTRGHQGLIIHISSFDQEGKECAIAKMNFLNLTGLFFSCVHLRHWLTHVFSDNALCFGSCIRLCRSQAEG